MSENTKKKNKRRTVWISDGLWARIEAAGQTDNRTASSWLRDRAEKALDQEERTAPKPRDCRYMRRP